jgi:hypothetical protein
MFSTDEATLCSHATNANNTPPTRQIPVNKPC